METNIRILLTDTLPVLSVSDSIRNLLGYSAHDFLTAKVSFRNSIHPDDGDIEDELFSHPDADKAGQFNIRLRKASGRICCIRGSYTKTATEDGQVLALSLQDAKSLYRSQFDLSGTKASVNSIAMMENTDDFIYFKDRNHVFTGASQTLVTLCDPAEHWTDLLGQTDYDVFPEQYADIYYRLEKQVFSGIEVAHEIQETQTKDGHNGYVDNRKYPIRNEQGEIIGLFGIARDITAQKLAEAALAESEEKHHRLFTGMTQAVLYLDSNGVILSANPASEKILDTSLAQMLGKTFMDPDWIMIREDGSHVSRSERPEIEAINTGKIVGPVIRALSHRESTSCIWLLITCIPMFRPGESTSFQVYAILEDITTRRAAEQRYEMLFREMLNGFALCEIICDEAGVPVDFRYLVVNPSFGPITGLDGQAIIGRTVREVVPQVEQYWIDTYGRVALTGKPEYFENYSETLKKHFSTSAYQPAPGQFAMIVSDITTQKNLQIELEKIGHYDPLTGLPNRLLLLDRMQQAMAQCARSNQKIIVAYLDLDGFKTVNDSRGHSAGDFLLCKVSEHMGAVLREGDTLGRIGGDEFVIVIGNVSDVESCTLVLQRLLVAAGKAVDYKGVSLQVSASMGVTVYPQADSVSADQLLRQADQAMYRAKLAGRNRYCFFTKEG